MPHTQQQFEAPPTGVERACQIVRNLFQHTRGNYETDEQAVAAIARQSRLTPAAVRRFIQPSRRPKDVSYTVWQRLVAAYRRYLARELAALQDEIDRLEALDPDDAALADLLRQARALCREVEAVAAPLSPLDDRTD